MRTHPIVVTLDDVAKAGGVSRATASRVLNGGARQHVRPALRAPAAGHSRRVAGRMVRHPYRIS
ncbi:LacI family DNA-binding transcriptional regulator [Amycolatopsis speibonae]|uniref:LacI family DNA-binding transcriptional regulator n=1 Tax=Amycolatopsis speibonae TaxID=1450224 RepID=A0ABV7P2Q3_9PSEU